MGMGLSKEGVLFRDILTWMIFCRQASIFAQDRV